MKNIVIFFKKLLLISHNHNLLTLSKAFSGSETNVFSFFYRSLSVIFGAYNLLYIKFAITSADCIFGLSFPFQNYPP